MASELELARARARARVALAQSQEAQEPGPPTGLPGETIGPVETNIFGQPRGFTFRPLGFIQDGEPVVLETREDPSIRKALRGALQIGGALGGGALTGLATRSPVLTGVGATAGELGAESLGIALGLAPEISPRTGEAISVTDPLGRLTELDIIENPALLNIGVPAVGRLARALGLGADVVQTGKRLQKGGLGARPSDVNKVVKGTIRETKDEAARRGARLSTDIDQAFETVDADGFFRGDLDAESLVIKANDRIRSLSNELSEELVEAETLRKVPIKVQFKAAQDYVDNLPKTKPKVKARAQRLLEEAKASVNDNLDGSLTALQDEKKRIHDFLADRAFVENPSTSEVLTTEIDKAITRDLRRTIEEEFNKLVADTTKQGLVKRTNRVLGGHLELRPILNRTFGKTTVVTPDDLSVASLVRGLLRPDEEALLRAGGTLRQVGRVTTPLQTGVGALEQALIAPPTRAALAAERGFGGR